MSSKLESGLSQQNSGHTEDIEVARLVDRFVRRIQVGLNLRAAVFDEHQVGPGGGILLLTLAEIEPAPIQEVVRQMARDKSQITRTVQSLERKGLIEREKSPDDARVSLLELTTEGKRTVEVLEAAVAEVVAGLLEPLSPEEQSALKAILRKI